MKERENTRLPYELFMLGLCVLALLDLGLGSFAHPGAEVRTILEWTDLAICAVFFCDFLVQLVRAESRSRYLLTWGWIDLLSSVPVMDGLLRVGRVARIWRVVRLFRGLKAARLIAGFIILRRAQGAFFAAVLLALLGVVTAAIAILQIERGPTARIHGPEDALWWAVATLTTVGYGDLYPVTAAGRLVGVGLMACGLGLTGTISGLMAAWFLAPAARHQDEEVLLLHEEIRALRRQLAEGRPSVDRDGQARGVAGEGRGDG